MKSGNYLRLSTMMFLQFFVWSAWFATIGLALGAAGMMKDFGGGTYGSAPIAAIIAPLFLGLIADRFFSSERVMGVLFILGGVFMWLAERYAVAGNGGMMVWMFIAHMLCYMPTLGLANTIAFVNISDQNDFPKIRVWGTIGWIVAGLFVGFMGWSASFNILIVAAISSIVLGVYSFTLPHTPAPAKGQPFNLRALFMVDAMKMLANPQFLVFMACSTLICIPLAYYYGLTSNYMSNVGFAAPAATMTIGQMLEIIFMLLIPLMFRRLGVKWMILIGMLSWVARYGLFALGAPHQIVWMIYLAVAMHGVCYDFFFVTGFMYTDKVASNNIRNQAQAMLVFFTQGVGMYFGYQIAFARVGDTVTHYSALTDAISKATTAPTTFVDSMLAMFKVYDLHALGINAQLISDTMHEWATFWWLPAGMAGVIAVIFFALFWDKMSNYEDKHKPVTDTEVAVAASHEEIK